MQTEDRIVMPNALSAVFFNAVLICEFLDCYKRSLTKIFCRLNWSLKNVSEGDYVMYGVMRFNDTLSCKTMRRGELLD